MVLTDERISGPEWANEEVDLWKFLFEDRRIPGEASAALCKVSESVSNWKISIFPEDRNAIKRAGYIIATNQAEQQIIPVILSGGNARRISAVVGVEGTIYPVNVREVASAAPASTEAPKVMQIPHIAPEPTFTHPSDGAGKASLYAKMARVMASLNTIPERGYNQTQNYRYVTDGDLYNVVRKAMAAQGLALITRIRDSHRESETITDRYGKERIQTLTFVNIDFTLACADSGATETIPWIGTTNNPGDKAISAAVTIAEKYFLKATFIISTGETADDPDSGISDVSAPTVSPESAPEPEPTAKSGLTKRTPPAPPQPPAQKPAQSEPATSANDAPGDVLHKLMNDSSVKAARASVPEARNTINKMWQEGRLSTSMSASDMVLAVVERLQNHRKGAQE